MMGAGRSSLLRVGAVFVVALISINSVLSAQDLLVVQRPAAESGLADTGLVRRCIDGSRIVRIHTDGSELLMTGGFLAACDPAVSFDGRQILFAGRRSATDRLQVWRMEADGTNSVRITNDPGGATAPLWVGSLFHLDDEAATPRIAYLATGHGWIDARTGAPAAALYTSDLDGGNPWRISFHPSSDLAPDVLDNGRLLFATSLTGGGDGRTSLMAVNNDGTDLMAFYDNHDGPPRPHTPRVGHDGRVFFVEADGSSPLGGGDLVTVTLRRPLHSRTVLAAAGSGAYLDPLPRADGGLMVSFRPPGEDSVYGLYRIDPTTGERLELVSTAAGFDTLDAQELRPHPRVKGRSSVVNLAQDTGVFFCISSHITDRPGLEHLRAGGATTLRVIEGLPDREGSAADVAGLRTKTLGEAPIEKDGSFHIEVPAGVPLRFALLDDAGATVAQQDSWTWVMPREWRGCIGCHEDREMVAPNVMAEAFSKPADRLGQPGEEVRP
jgi:hypothetical protein